MNSVKKALAILLSAITVFTSLPVSAISAFASEMSNTVICYSCNGIGYTDCTTCNSQGTIQQACATCVDGLIETDCDICGGDGFVADEQQTPSPCPNENCVEGKITSSCSDCSGTGYILTDCEDCDEGHVTCAVCEGNGTIELVEDESFKFSDSTIGDTYSIEYEEGKTFSMKAESSDQNGREITYSSSDSEVASIDENGTVSILSAGETKITATIAADNRIYKETVIECALTIEKASQQFSMIAPANSVIVCGESFPLVVMSDNENQNNVEFSIESDAEQYIDLNNNEKTITAKKATPAGTQISVTATIPESANYKAGEAKISFSVAKAEIKNFAFVTPNPVDIVVGEELDNGVVFDDADVQYEIVEGADCATLEGSKLVATKSGTVKVKATVLENDYYNSASALYTVNIVDNNSTIKFTNSGNITIPYGTVFANTLINVPEGETVQYDTEDETIATVDEQGRITTVKPGTVRILATVDETTFDYVLNIAKADQELQFENKALIVGYGESFTFTVNGAGEGTNTVFSLENVANAAQITQDGVLSVSALNSVNSAIVVKASNDGNEYYNPASVSCQVVISKQTLNIEFNDLGEDGKVPFKDNGSYEFSFKQEFPENSDVDYTIQITEGEDCAQIVGENNLKTLKPGKVAVLCTFRSALYNIAPITYSFEIVKANQDFTFAQTSVELKYGQAYQQKAVLNGGSGNDIKYEFDNQELINSVDENGAVTFVDKATGTATITATVDGNECYNDATASYTITVAYADQPSNAYTISPEVAGVVQWYNSRIEETVKINAPEGYYISTDNSLSSTNVWQDAISLQNDGIYTDTVVYLKDKQDNGITDAITVTDVISIDKTAPAAPEISYSSFPFDYDPDKDSLLSKILNVLYGYTVKVEFKSDDATSGVSGFQYTIKDNTTGEISTRNVSVDEEGGNTFTDEFTEDKSEFEILTVTAIDAAGNYSNVTKADGTVIIVDRTAADIDIEYPNTEHVVPASSEDEKDTLYYGINDLEKIDTENGSVSGNADTVTLPIKFVYTEDNYDSTSINSEDINGRFIDNGCSIKVSVNGQEPEYIDRANFSFDDEHKTVTYNMNIDMANHLSDGTYVFYISYTDFAGNPATAESYNVVIDTTAPVVSVSDNLDAANTIDPETQEKTYYTDSEGYIYYTGGEDSTPLTMTYSVTEKNLNDTGFTVSGKISNYDADDAEENEKEFDISFTGINNQEGNIYKNELSFSSDARYEYAVEIVDLAGNKAVMASEDEQQTDPIYVSDVTNRIVYDNSAPEIDVQYEQPSIAQRVLQGITFGIYKAQTTVTVTAEDTVSDIYSLSYGAYVQDGASAANISVDEVTLTYGNEGFFDIINDNNGSVKTTFSIDPQFRGFVKATVFTFGQLEDAYDGASDDLETGVIVDAKAPEGKLEINNPLLVLDKDNNIVNYTSLEDFVNSDQSDDCRFIYADPAEITIYITEDNFDLNAADDGNIAADDDSVIGEGESSVNVGTTVVLNGKELQDLTWEKVQNESDDSNSSDVFKTTVNLDEEGYYVLEVYSVDIAGNQMPTIKKSFTLDDTAPEVTNFKISTEGDYYYKDQLIINGEAQQEQVNPENNSQGGNAADGPFGTSRYDYYFTTYTEIEVTATDLFVTSTDNTDTETQSDEGEGESGGQTAVNQQESGVKEIILLLQDCDANTWSVCEPISSSTTNNSDLTSTFKIDGPFKGNLYAIPIDRCGHFPYFAESTNAALETFNWITRDSYKDDIQYVLDWDDQSGNSDTQTRLENAGLAAGAGFVAPYDVIIEDDTVHQDHSSISISYSEEVTETERTRDRYIDENRVHSVVGNIQRDQHPDFVNSVETDVPLFRSDVDITVNVRDYYSAIRSVDLYVLGREGQDTENNTHETLRIDNDASLSSENWTAQAQADNLIYEVERTITVSNDSNDIIILVVLTDRSGNKSYDYNVIGIDKTAPQITLSYSDNNVRTGNYNDFYNHRRTATITVDERNFDTSYITATLSNIDRSYSYAPNISNITQESAWSSNNDPNNPIYTYVIEYTSSGTFDFRMSLNDAAGNASNVVSSRFTIDLIRPYIAVSLDANNVVQNGNYFNRTRTATIVVTEHNFNQREFENLIRSSLNGRSITVPSISNFVSAGNDTWRATVVFSGDGDYLLDFAYTDKAGNRYEIVNGDYTGVAATDFTIDKTAPVIDIDVNDRYSYIEGPVVTVTERDNNCSDITTSMSGTVYENEFVTIDINSTETTMRQDHHYADFVVTYDQISQDGYYTVEASCVDMAGNRSNTVSKVFTKNEFGSVYALSPDLSDAVQDAYVNKDKYFSGSSENIYIDEYSPVPIAAEDSEFYININSRRQNDGISRVEISTVDGWYLYRYIIDNDKLSAEGLYNIYLRSTVNMDSGTVINNSQDASDNHRLNIGFTIDNTNPFVRIGGLQDHINNRTTEKDVTLTVSDNNLHRIKAIVEKGDQTTTYVWVSNPDDYTKDDPNEIVDSFIDENNPSSSLAEVSFPLALESSENSAQYNIRLEISDLAGNYARNADDYNKDELFTDAYGRLDYLFDSNSEGADSVMNYLELSDITLSKSFAIGQMIRDNQPIAIAIFAAIAVLLLLIIIIPIIIKKRKKLDEQDAKEVE